MADYSDYTKVCAHNDGELPGCQIKLYKRRWFILILFTISTASSTAQWIQYSIIANTVVEYYEVSYTAVDWTSMIYLLVYIPLIFPGCYVLDTLGLRVAVLCGMVGTTVGAWIKVASVSPDRFWVVILGQCFVGASEVFMLGIPSKLAAVWFGIKEVSSACSIGVFGIQLGIAFGFLLPPMLVDSQAGKEGIEYGLYCMLISIATLNTILLVILFIFFKEKPPTPPSPAQSEVDAKREFVSFRQSLKVLLKNRSFVLLTASYGIVLGIFYAISQLLNQIILHYYPGAETDAGRIGLIIVVTGMIGSIACGVILDLFNKFKVTILTVYALGLLSMVAFTFTLDAGITTVYIVASFIGFFMTALFPIGFELAAELTYPVEEGTSGGILIGIAQLFGIAFTYFYSHLFNSIGEKTTNLIICGMLGAGLFCLFFVRFDLRRRAIQVENKKPQIVKFNSHPI